MNEELRKKFLHSSFIVYSACASIVISVVSAYRESGMFDLLGTHNWCRAASIPCREGLWHKGASSGAPLPLSDTAI
jgi:hypothetical protein